MTMTKKKRLGRGLDALLSKPASPASVDEATIEAPADAGPGQDQLKKLISDDLDPGSRLTRLNLVEQVRRPNENDLPSLDQAIQDALENRTALRNAEYENITCENGVLFDRNETSPSAFAVHQGEDPGDLSSMENPA